MFSALTERLRSEVEAVKSVLATHDQIRTFLNVADGAPKEVEHAGEGALAQIRTNTPSLISWRTYDHCASFTRLYGLYERFVTDIVDAWLDLLPDLYPKYSDLPEQVLKGHRIGVAEILIKLGGDQYQHLSEKGILEGIFGGITGRQPYSCLHDAFFTDDKNLWPTVVGSLFAKVGVPEAWQWINRHRKVVRFIQEVRGNSSSAESELRNFLQYRNRAAHGETDDLVAVEEIRKIGDFVVAMCEALAELVMFYVMERRREAHLIEPIGKIIRDFGGRVVGVETAPAMVAVGDKLIVLRENACYSVLVQHIEENHVEFKSMKTTQSQRIALQLDQKAKVGAELIRMLQMPSIEPLGDGI